MKLGWFISLMICLSILAVPVLAEETEFAVDFSANVTEGIAPLAVQFNNLVTGNQISGNWTIGTELIEGLPGPEYTFTEPGSYTVSLTVTDDTETTLTETKVDYIVVSSSIPYTVFSFTSAGIWGSNPVIITDKSSGDVVFVGKTSSKNVQLNSSGHYSIDIQRGGLTDYFNSPDFAIGEIAGFASQNLIGILIGGSIMLILVGIIFRRK